MLETTFAALPFRVEERLDIKIFPIMSLLSCPLGSFRLLKMLMRDIIHIGLWNFPPCRPTFVALYSFAGTFKHVYKCFMYVCMYLFNKLFICTCIEHMCVNIQTRTMRLFLSLIIFAANITFILYLSNNLGEPFFTPQSVFMILISKSVFSFFKRVDLHFFSCHFSIRFLI